MITTKEKLTFRPAEGPRIRGIEFASPAYYAEIESISVPAAAFYGELVTVDVRVRNLHTAPIYIAATARYDGNDLFFGPDYASVGAGEVFTFSSYFTMPDKAIEFHVWSFYWTDDGWYQDDYSPVSIALEEIIPPEEELPLPLWPLAIIGGVGILGIVAAVALTTRQK